MYLWVGTESNIILICIYDAIKYSTLRGNCVCVFNALGWKGGREEIWGRKNTKYLTTIEF